jgi:hypothetical protein
MMSTGEPLRVATRPSAASTSAARPAWPSGSPHAFLAEALDVSAYDRLELYVLSAPPFSGHALVLSWGCRWRLARTAVNAAFQGPWGVLALSNGDLLVSNEYGNTVDRAQEMAKMAENQLMYDASAEILKKKLGMLKYAIGEGGGNR